MTTEQAIESLSALQAQFDNAATDARTPRFFQSWFVDQEAVALEYQGFSAAVGQVIDSLNDENTQAATTGLLNLKGQFSARHDAWEQAANGFFSSWFGKETKKATEFEGYVQKVDAVLAQLG